MWRLKCKYCAVSTSKSAACKNAQGEKLVNLYCKWYMWRLKCKYCAVSTSKSAAIALVAQVLFPSSIVYGH